MKADYMFTQVPVVHDDLSDVKPNLLLKFMLHRNVTLKH